MNVQDAAIQILKEAGLWSSDGKTPEATVGARLYSDIKKRIEHRTPELEKAETDFSAALTPAGFADEKSFLEARLPHEERESLASRAKELDKFASPDRPAISNPLEVDAGCSDASFFGSLALLPASEQVILEQNDWSEERNINPYAVFEKPPAMLQVTTNIGRPGQPADQ